MKRFFKGCVLLGLSSAVTLSAQYGRSSHEMQTASTQNQQQQMGYAYLKAPTPYGNDIDFDINASFIYWSMLEDGLFYALTENP